MGSDNFLSLVFFIVAGLAMIVDLFILSRVQEKISTPQAVIQSVVWISLALAFGGLILYVENKERFIDYFTAYTMEYSLSMDNVFVFILIFGFFKVTESNTPKVLFYGILIAILLRIIFIWAGVALVEKFDWLIYIFGAVLVYTGVKILIQKEGDETDPSKNFLYRFFKKNLNIVENQDDGKLVVKKDGKNYFTILFLVVVVIGSTDLVFAIDSIPAAFGITSNKMVIMTSNIFAVMGLRAMFFMLKGAVNKFHFLQQGISVVLMFIGVKMLLGIFHWEIPNLISLSAILSILFLAIIISLMKPEKKS